MKNKHFLYLTVAVLLASVVCFGCKSTVPDKPAAVQTPVEKHGQLSIVGTHLVDQNGKSVQLRGMSFFWSQWQGSFYNPTTVKWLKDDWQNTVVRAAMGVDMGGYLKNPEAEKQKVITVVEAAIKEGIYVIIDWHDHEAHKHTEEAKAFFSEMAQHYGEYPNVIYEPYNEPLQDADWAAQIKPYHETIIQEIRKHDPDNVIVCGTRMWSQRVDEAAENPINARNIAYTLHYYAATHKQDLRNIASKAIAKGAPLFVTEFGTCAADGNGKVDEAESKAWWAFLDQHQISWCNWSVANKDEAASALKPGSPVAGPWTEANISPSGQLVRQELLEKARQEKTQP
ncbi:glycoside hydrolase family 5 protein [Rufibacter aurantiacus]|uniref:glycoside hydrolase family 5 protein n=1 Tax=Rufibacter aurantiacus TaxID=2817374 RepID=UPI001FEE8B8B|nr:glycoside hydrolase family 5 protein [Rufibacter aurantiacus]